MDRSHAQERWAYKGLSASMAVMLAFGMIPMAPKTAFASLEGEMAMADSETAEAIPETDAADPAAAGPSTADPSASAASTLASSTVDPSIEKSDAERGMFKTLQEALDSAQDGARIVLKGDVVENLSIERNVTVDGTGQYGIVGKTELKKGTLKDLTLSAPNGTILVLGSADRTAEVLMDGVTVKYPVAGAQANAVNVLAGNNAAIRVSGCSFSNDAQNDGVTVKAPQWSYGVYVNAQGEHGSVSFEGSSFEGAFRTMLANVNGAFTVSGCAFANSIFSNDSGSTSGAGEEATCLTTADSPVDKVRVEGSVFDNAGALYFQKTQGAVVSGNTFKFDKFAHFIQAKGAAAAPLDLKDNTFVMGENRIVAVDVERAPVILPAGVRAVSYWAWSDTEANIRPSDYFSYEYEYNADGTRSFFPKSFAALKAFVSPAEGNIGVGDSETVLLQNDIVNARGLTIASGKKFTLDFGGREYTLVGPGAGSKGTETNAFQLLKDSDLTFKNGTVKVAKGAVDVKRLVQSYANVTFEDMVFESANLSDGENLALSFNNGTVRFKGKSSILSSSENVLAFDVYYWASAYPNGVSVSFDDGYKGTVTGRIVYDSSEEGKASLRIAGQGSFGGVGASEGSSKTPDVSISGGTFRAAPALSYIAEGRVLASFYADDAGAEAQDPAALVGHAVGDKAAFDLSLVASPEKPGRVFAGWKSSEGKLYRPDEKPSLPGRTVFTAQWSSPAGKPDVNPPSKEDAETAEKVVSNPDGSQTTIVSGKDGSKVATTVSADKTASTVVTKDPKGNVVSIEGHVAGETAPKDVVRLPMEPVTASAFFAGASLSLGAPKGAKVALPVAASKPSMALALVKEDGSATVLPKTAILDGVLGVEVPGDCTLKLVDSPADFPDVAGNEWFAWAGVVDFASSRGILSGVALEDGSAEFRGDLETSRAMFVTMLSRLELEPSAAKDAPSFPDVEESVWYGNPAAWAAEQGLLAGYERPDGTSAFGGDNPVTREQIAVFLMRYAKWLGRDTSARALAAPGAPTADLSSVSDWAFDAVSWAVAEGYLLGDGGTGLLRPGDGATRAEVAAIVMRFVNSLR